MKYTVICDESGLSERHLIVGSLTLPRHNHAVLSAELTELKRSLGFRPEGELKWGKLSRTYLDRYQEVAMWFFTHLKANQLRFRAHVIDTASGKYRAYGEGDREKSFYKVFYHLLFQCVCRLAEQQQGDTGLLVLMDDKRNRYPFQLPTLKRALNWGLMRKLGYRGLVSNVEARQSSGPRAEPMIQIVDLLIGAIGYVRNGHIEKPDAAPFRPRFVRFMEQQAGTSFHLDTAASAAFNVWTFDVSVAMQRKMEHKKRNRPTA